MACKNHSLLKISQEAKEKTNNSENGWEVTIFYEDNGKIHQTVLNCDGLIASAVILMAV